MKLFTQRFQELFDQLKQVEAAETRQYSEFRSSSYQHIEADVILNWAVKVRNLISSACGKDSEHYTSFIQAEEPQSYEDSKRRVRFTHHFFTSTHYTSIYFAHLLPGQESWRCQWLMGVVLITLLLFSFITQFFTCRRACNAVCAC